MKSFRLLLLLLLPAFCHGQNIHTILGTGDTAYNVSSGIASASSIQPLRVAIDKADGSMYVSSHRTPHICKVDLSSGSITTYAGNGIDGFSGDGGPAINASIDGASSLSVDKHGDLFFHDAGNRRIRKVEKTTGIISTVAGNGTYGLPTPGNNALNEPFPMLVFMAVDSSSNIIFADWGSSSVKKIDATTNVVSELYNNGSSYISSICIGDDQNIYFSEPGVIKKIDVNNTVSTVAGIPSLPCSVSNGSLSSTPVDAETMTICNNNELYFTETSCSVVKRLDIANDTIHIIAGNGSQSYSGDGGPAINSTVDGPRGIATDSCGNVYICDVENFRVRRIDNSPLCYPLSISRAKKESGVVSVWPNPASSSVTVSSGDEIASVSVVDVTGRVVWNSEFVIGNSVVLDVSGFASGVYFVAVRHAQGDTSVVKFMRE